MISNNRIKDIREDNDINQEKMAEILNVKRSTYSLWELGINSIPLKVLIDYSNYFHLNIDYILRLTNNKVIKNKDTKLNLKVVGENIKRIRNKHNLSQENIAKLLSVTQPAINKYEKGKSTIPVDNLYILSKEFNISIDDLIDKH